MKSHVFQNAARYSGHFVSQSGFSDSMLLATIGDTLREKYGDLTLSATPDDLLRLARIIDQRREAGDGQD